MFVHVHWMLRLNDVRSGCGEVYCRWMLYLSVRDKADTVNITTRCWSWQRSDQRYFSFLLFTRFINQALFFFITNPFHHRLAHNKLGELIDKVRYIMTRKHAVHDCLPLKKQRANYQKPAQLDPAALTRLSKKIRFYKRQSSGRCCALIRSWLAEDQAFLHLFHGKCLSLRYLSSAPRPDWS